MKKAIIALCVVALLLNLYFVSWYNLEDEDIFQKFFFGAGGGLENKTSDDENGDSNGLTITVPEPKLGDEVYYTYDTYIEMAGENTSSGEWWSIILDADGDLENKIPPETEMKMDGFFIKHNAVRTYQRTTATFTVTYDASDMDDPLVIHGSGWIKRSEFQDLTTNSVISMETEAEANVDQTFSIDVPLQYTGNLRSYPDPSTPKVKTLDDIIYLNNKTLGIGDNGSELRTGDFGVLFNFPFSVDTYYNWTIEEGQMISEVETLKVNITTKFLNFLNFQRDIWISNEVSEPVKMYLRINYSYSTEEESEYMILEQTQTMTGYRQGTRDIPWGTCNSVSPEDPEVHFSKTHPSGNFETWDYMPVSAAPDEDFEDSSFEFAPEAATEFATLNSDGLIDFMDDFNWDCIVSHAKYNVTRDAQDLTDPDDQAGDYHWNLTFGYYATREEYYDEYARTGENPKFRYNLMMDLDKERNLNPLPTQPDYNEETLISEDQGRINRSISLSRSDLNRELLTLISSEEIFKMDADIYEKIFNSPSEGGKIWWDDPTHERAYELDLGGETAQNDPIVATITGISFPPDPRISWTIHKESLISSGYMFMAVIDAETGQLNYVMEIEGTALMGLVG